MATSWKTDLTRAALALTLLALLAAPRSATAQEDAEAPDSGLGPTIEFTDRKKVISIQLPRAYETRKDVKWANQLGAWEGPLGPDKAKDPSGLIIIQATPNYRRASLAVEAIRNNYQGEVLEGSVRTGADFYEHCHRDGQSRFIQWVRSVEKGGITYTAQLRTGPQLFERTKPAVQAVLGSFKVPGDFAVRVPPEDWKTQKHKPFMTATDSDNKSAIGETMKLLNVARTAVAKTLKGKPFDTSTPQVWLYQNNNTFKTDTRAAMGATPENAGFAPANHAVMVSLMSQGKNGFDQPVWASASRQYLWQYFGGPPPFWLQQAYSTYAVHAGLSGGKGDKPADQFIKSARSAIPRSRPLDEWFKVPNLQDEKDDQRAQAELWAWLWWFRHGKAKKVYRKAFEGFVQTLRETGDMDEAMKAWADIDFAAMHAAFKKFGKKWD